ncbi:MAG: NADH-quinone oxidoreductase subunit A [Candidatus Nezhaarchaeales archaeon]
MSVELLNGFICLWRTAPEVIALIVYIVISILVPVLLYVGGRILGPSKPTPEKTMTFECGQVPVGKAHLRITAHYYPYALIYAIYTALAIILLFSAPGIAKLEAETKGYVFGFVGLPFVALVVTALTLFSATIALSSYMRGFRRG